MDGIWSTLLIVYIYEKKLSSFSLRTTHLRLGTSLTSNISIINIIN